MFQRYFTLLDKQVTILRLNLFGQEIEVGLEYCLLVLWDLTDFSKSPLINNYTSWTDNFSLGKCPFKDFVALDIKVFSNTRLYCQVIHAFCEAEDLNFNF